MTKRMIVLAALLLLSAQASVDAQLWRRVPLDTDFNLTSIQFVNNSVGYIGGWRISDKGISEGILLTTQDGGATWESQEFSDVISMSFPGNNTGYVFAHSEQTPYKTTDGGSTWDTLSNFQHASGINEAIYFINDSVGFISGTYLASIARTTDGGKTSTVVYSNDGGNIGALHFPTPEVGYAAGAGSILKTMDAGQTWYRVYQNFDPTAPLWDPQYIRAADIAFLDRNHGVVVGDSLKVFTTDDGGVTWTLDRVPLFVQPDTELRALHFINDSLGYAVGQDGLILSTAYAGQHWSLEHYDFMATGQQQLRDVFCLDNGVCFAVGDSGLLMTNTPATSVGDDVRSGAISVSPNPAAQTVTVQYERCGIQPPTVRLFDLTGRPATEEQKLHPHAEGYQSTIYVESLHSGTYIVQVRCGNRTTSRKLHIIR